MIKFFVIPILIIALGSFLVIWSGGKEGWVPQHKQAGRRIVKRYGYYFTGLGIISLSTTIAILWNQF